MEPFGYFKAEPFGWTDCAETDEGAQPLFDQAAIDAIERQRNELLAALEFAQDKIAELHIEAGDGECHYPIIDDAVAYVKGGAA